MRNFLLGMVALVVLAACAEEQAPAGPVVDIDAGKAIAEASCSGCHGLDGCVYIHFNNLKHATG